jgi:hypothetical protein
MTVTPQEELYELNLQLSNELPIVSDLLRSDAYAMQNCRHAGLISNCHSRFCLMCGRRRAEVLNVKLHDRVKTLQSNLPDARFLFATLPAFDTPTTGIRSSASRLRDGLKSLLKPVHGKPVHGLLGHFTAMEVTASDKSPELENVHLHSIVALNPRKHVGDNYISYQKWAANWQDEMQGLAREADVQRPRNLTHVIDYILKPSLKDAIDRAKEALANPARYVERVRQLWHYPQRWAAGKLGSPTIAAIEGPDLSGLNNVNPCDLEYETAKPSRPRTTKNLPILIAESE